MGAPSRSRNVRVVSDETQAEQRRFMFRLQNESLDALLAACLVAIAILTAEAAATRGEEGSEAPENWWSWALVLVPPLAVAFRTRAPLVATPVAVVGQMAIWVSGLASVVAAPLVMIYSVAMSGGRRAQIMGFLSVVALGVTAIIGWLTAPDVDVDLAALTILAGIIVYLLGTTAASQRAEASSLAASLAVSRMERQSELERATSQERQRIARDLHDLVGHSLSVIAVRAEAAQRVAPKKPEAAAEALVAVADTARSSLGEVRRVLFALRTDDEKSELSPLPGLGDIESMVAEAAGSAGIDATCAVGVAEAAIINSTVAAAAYRIVQESLTNSIKHAGPRAAVSVDITTEGHQLSVRVDDDGQGPQASPEPSQGAGLIGMRERAELLGGALTAGPRPGGGFRVVAHLPLTPPAPGGEQ